MSWTLPHEQTLVNPSSIASRPMHGELQSLKSLVLCNTDQFQTLQPLYCFATFEQRFFANS